MKSAFLRSGIAWSTVVVVIISGLVFAAMAQERKPLPPPLMRQKLTEVSNIAEGLALKKLDKVSIAASELMKISIIDQWSKVQGPVYGRFSEDFRDAVTRMGKAADRGELEAATLHFNDAFMSCIQCHQFMRDLP